MRSRSGRSGFFHDKGQVFLLQWHDIAGYRGGALLLALQPYWFFMRRIFTSLAFSIVAGVTVKAQDAGSLAYGDEKHFRNVRQLTNGGDNAEAYFGFDNEHITFQYTNPKAGVPCDQIYYG